MKTETKHEYLVVLLDDNGKYVDCVGCYKATNPIDAVTMASDGEDAVYGAIRVSDLEMFDVTNRPTVTPRKSPKKK